MAMHTNERPHLKQLKKEPGGAGIAVIESPESVPQTWLQIAQLRAEKCELKEARVSYFFALQQAKKIGDVKSTIEAIAGLLRLASEALDEESIEKWDSELDVLIRAYPRQIPPMVWYCRGALARHRRDYMLAQRHFHRYLRAVKSRDDSESEQVARGRLMLATVLQERGRSRRSEWLANEVLRRYGVMNFRGINGIAYLLLGTLSEYQQEYKTALKWFQKAYGQFMADHNWYYILYVLYGYARIERRKSNFSQAGWFLDLVDKAALGPEFGLLRRQIGYERSRLEKESVDLLIDSNKGVVQTREGESIALRKQNVLIQILEALSSAHGRKGGDRTRGLSKAEIIRYVWKEDYKPSLHDNKLYYNINRLRKLIESDVRKPHYLLSWKDGYRLAPGLRVKYVGAQEPQYKGDSS